MVDQMVPYVTENIQSQNWRQREAAVMAFGAVLEVREGRLKGQSSGLLLLFFGLVFKCVSCLPVSLVFCFDLKCGECRGQPSFSPVEDTAVNVCLVVAA